MSVCRPARCLFSKATGSIPKPAPPSRSFTTTAPRPARRRRSHYPSIKAEDLKLLNAAADSAYPKYDTTESDLLSQRYTPAQMAAIKAAESVIDSKDVLLQGHPRTDPWRLPYEDDLAEMHPVHDHAEKFDADDIKGSKNFRQANPRERDAAIKKYTMENMAKLYPDGLPEGPLNPTQKQEYEEKLEAASQQAFMDPRIDYTYRQNYSTSTEKFRKVNEEAFNTLGDPRHSVIMPSLPRIDSAMIKATTRLSKEERDDPRKKQLMLSMRWDKNDLQNIRTKTLVTHFVTNQTRMGKIQSMYYLTVAGNGQGLVGVGEGKSVEPEEGRQQSIMSAIRNMKPVPRYENRTIYGTLEKKVAATKVQLFSRPPGFGLRCQHLIFEMARMAGIHDLAAKTPRSRNKMNVIKATWAALTEQRLPDEIARGRGKKLVDVRKVYYGGSVH